MHLSFTPMACKVDGLHPHQAPMRTRNFTKSKVMVFYPARENRSAPAQDRLNTPGTLGTLLTSDTYKYPGAPRKMDHGRRRAKAPAKMQAAHGSPLVMQQSTGRVRSLMVQTFIHPHGGAAG
jgi:hypothetical protein